MSLPKSGFRREGEAGAGAEPPDKQQKATRALAYKSSDRPSLNALMSMFCLLNVLPSLF